MERHHNKIADGVWRTVGFLSELIDGSRMIVRENTSLYGLETKLLTLLIFFMCLTIIG